MCNKRQSVVSNGVLQGGGTFVTNGVYTEAYHGPNNEQPSNAGDSNHGQGAAVFKLLS